MTSEEIANFDYEKFKGDFNASYATLKFVKEIAYQLAKLNEHFEEVDSAVFGDKI